MNCIMCNKENAEVKINDKIAMCQKCSDQELLIQGERK